MTNAQAYTVLRQTWWDFPTGLQGRLRAARLKRKAMNRRTWIRIMDRKDCWRKHMAVYRATHR